MPRNLSSSPAHQEMKPDAGEMGGPAKVSLAPAIAFGLMLVLAAAVGGGGSRYAFANLVVQLGALALLAYQRDAAFGFWRGAPRGLRLLVAASLLLPLLQLVPLPEAMWSALPGRDLVAQAFELTGRTGWAPGSVDPVRTLLALTGMIVPVTILITGWTIPRSQLLMLGWLVVALALLNVLIGIPQVLIGGGAGVFYQDGNAQGVLSGTFANRNSTGLLLVGAISLAGLLPAPRPHSAILPARLIIILLLIVGVVLTRSRTAMALTLIPVALIVLRAFWWSRKSNTALYTPTSRMRLGVFAAIIIGLGALASVAAIAPGRVAQTMERFEATGDARVYIWEDAAYSASRYWPAGAGMGTFDEVFQVDESLENNTERRAGRAHNDFLELTIEAGLPGLILLALWLAMTAWLTWRARLSRLRWAAWGAASFLLIIALQSVTDYPLRNQAMLAMASFALLLLARVGGESRDRTETAP